MVLTRGQLQRQGQSLEQVEASISHPEQQKHTTGPGVLTERPLNAMPDTQKPFTGLATDGSKKKPVGDDRPLKRLPEVAQTTDKLPDGPEPVAIEVEYPARSELQPVAGDPLASLETLPIRLGSSDWVEACAALTTLRQVAIHADKALLEPKLGQLTPLVIKSVRSLRSSVSKTAILTVGDLLQSLGDVILPHLDIGGPAAPTTSLLCCLLLKAASNEKQFVVIEAQNTLQCHAAEHIDPDALSKLLLPYTEHKNPKVRARAAVVLELAQGRSASSSAHASLPLTTLLSAAGRLITDNVPEAREAAKKLLVNARDAFAREEGSEAIQAVIGPAILEEEALAAAAEEESASVPSSWELYCRKVLSGTAAIAVLKVQQ